jgi:primary-amine oxidase
LENVIGVFERVTGNPEWRHFELFSPGGPAYEGRAEVELVMRMIAQVGNYDYVIDWVFTQRATIRVDVALTGIDAAKGVRSTHLNDPTAAADTAHGTLVAPQLVATNHSHHFNFRLDLDIDGPTNSFAVGEIEPQRLHRRQSPRRSVWTLKEDILKHEKDLTAHHHDHARWRVFSPTRKNASGYSTGYLLESQSHDGPLLHPEDYARAGFIEHPLWLTAYNPDQLFAAGDTPNQNPGRPGLPEYIKNNESVASRDIVLWHTLSHHHVPVAEDWPVLPRASMSFELKPANFFDHNPALDLRRAPFEQSP